MGDGGEGAPSSRAPLYTGLRPLRTFCMLSIVAYHTSWSLEKEPDPLLGVSFGLTTLQVVLCALVARGSREPVLSTFVQRRARRLLRPWILWSALYIGLQILQSIQLGNEWSDRLVPSRWLRGGSFHLWFLPYGFAASLLALLATRACRGHLAARGACIASMLGALLLLLAQVSASFLQPSPPLDLWLDGLPAVAFGVAIGRALSIRELPRQRALLAGIAAVSLLPLLLGSYLVPSSHLWPGYAIAVPLACLGFSIPFPEFRVLTWLAGVNMGVYLVHIIALHLVDRVEWLLGASDLLRVIAVYLLSVALVSLPPLLLKRLRGQISVRIRSTLATPRPSSP